MTRPHATASAVVQFKVFVKGADGVWRVASQHITRREAEEIADLLTVREGRLTRVML